MFLTLHATVETGVNRSFDRSFLLTPAPPGSRALQYGLPVVVMNDMLHVRNYVQTSGDAQAKAPQIGSPGPSLSLPPSSLSLTPTKSTVPLFGATSSSPFTSSTSSEVRCDGAWMEVSGTMIAS